MVRHDFRQQAQCPCPGVGDDRASVKSHHFLTACVAHPMDWRNSRLISIAFTACSSKWRLGWRKRQRTGMGMEKEAGVAGVRPVSVGYLAPSTLQHHAPAKARMPPVSAASVEFRMGRDAKAFQGYQPAIWVDRPRLPLTDGSVSDAAAKLGSL